MHIAKRPQSPREEVPDSSPKKGVELRTLDKVVQFVGEMSEPHQPLER